MVDTVLFDLDNTLLDFNKAEKMAVERTLREMGVTPDERMLKRYSELNLAQWHLLEQGKITRSQVKVQRYVNLFREYHIEGDPAEATKVYEAYLAIGHYYVEGAEELLKHLSEKYRLYMVTNGTLSVQKGRIKSAGMRPYFKDIFISEEIGYDKPGKAYFDYCFSRISNFHRENTVIIGDSLTSDILGGKNAGIRTVWYNPHGSQNTSAVQPDYEVKELSAIEDLLEKI